MEGARPIPRLAFGARIGAGERMLPDEAAVALSFNGTTQAVMMATPADLEDFARGFALTEGIARWDEILSVEVQPVDGGFDVQSWLAPEAAARLSARRRSVAGPVGCGLCGIDSIAQALREPEPLPPSPLRLTPAEVHAAVAALSPQQHLGRATRATHGAAFWVPGAGLLALREDVGRHNALDKLAGHLARGPHPEGAVILTSRISIDLVQKVAMIGAPVMVAVSAPTAQSVALADRLGITLIALARSDGFELYTHSDRLLTEVAHET